MLCPWVKCPGAVRPMSSCCAWTHPDLWTLQPDAKKTCFLELWPCNSVAYLELRQTVLNLFSITVSSIATYCLHKSTGFPNPPAHVSMFVMPGRVISPWLEARTAWTRTAWTAWFWTCKGNMQLKQLLHFNITPLKIWLFANFILQAVGFWKTWSGAPYSALQCQPWNQLTWRPLCSDPTRITVTQPW